ncbi:CapA family protein [Candidatus Parabeggiatoa sp. HSG14]|uniref:CapA family protein n=1 Tax=Candidatus Parabeggiatoa sp. HSG14 TaxID=3055593 RepID=UPI0025A835EE|nr:CapA family protein [Thiotrichales bacterium HSG14]
MKLLKKILALITLLSVLVISITLGRFSLSTPMSDKEIFAVVEIMGNTILPIANAQSSETVSIIGVGDIMLGTNYPSTKYLPPNKGKNLLTEVNAILKNADVTFGNLEGTILNKGATIKNCKNCYSFRMPEYLANNLVTAGFDVMSIANNHIRDFGNTGINNTIRVLREKEINIAGVLNHPSVTFTKNGVTYGFAAFAPNRGTVKITNISNAKKITRQLAKTSDIVIISFHGGAEGSKHQHVPKKIERYYGENRGNVHQFAHAVIDAGADIVFGHGPHVTRAVEVYKNRFIAYSLGNFCTYGRFNLRGVNGVAPIIKVNVDTQGGFLNAQITPIKQIKWKGVVRDSQKKAISLIRKLTKADGFLHNISIDNNGLISKL